MSATAVCGFSTASKNSSQLEIINKISVLLLANFWSGLVWSAFSNSQQAPPNHPVIDVNVCVSVCLCVDLVSSRAHSLSLSATVSLIFRLLIPTANLYLERVFVPGRQSLHNFSALLHTQREKLSTLFISGPDKVDQPKFGAVVESSNGQQTTENYY